jgi:hypothetical protein
MAKAIIILDDDGPDGEVNIHFRFEPNGIDEQSSAHALAARLLGTASALHQPDVGEGA